MIIHRTIQIALVTFLVALGDAQSQIEQLPTPAWSGRDPEPFPVASPLSEGFDPKTLASAAAYAEEIGSDSLLVIRNGHLVLERYWNGKSRSDLQQMYSATKSPFSFLIGRAIQRGYVDSLEQQLVDIVPEMRGMGRERLTFRNIMAMESGLDQSRSLDDDDAVERRTQLEAVQARAVTKEPYTWYHYNNAAYRALFVALERASGLSLPEFTRSELFEPLNMQGAYWIELREDDRHIGYQSIRMRPVDLAKVGQVVLEKGYWNGKPYLRQSFIEELITAPVPDVNPAYGLFWHLNCGAFYRSYYDSARVDRNLLANIPTDAIANYGFGGQVLVVVPSLTLVIVRTGPDIPSTIWEVDDCISTLSAIVVDSVSSTPDE